MKQFACGCVQNQEQRFEQPTPNLHVVHAQFLEYGGRAVLDGRAERRTTLAEQGCDFGPGGDLKVALEGSVVGLAA